MPNQPLQTDTGSLKLYQDCSKLTLVKFLDCLFDDDLGVLIISGSPSKEQLQEAWNKIYLEYCTLIQDRSYNELFEKSKEVVVLQAKISLVDSIVKNLCLAYDPVLVKMLDNLGLKSKVLPEDDGDVLQSKLEAVITRARRWITQLDIKNDELQKLRKKNENSKGGREVFDDYLGNLSKFNGYYVNEREITVGRFCRDLNRMNEVLERDEVKKTIKK